MPKFFYDAKHRQQARVGVFNRVTAAITLMIGKRAGDPGPGDVSPREDLGGTQPLDPRAGLGRSR